MGLRFRMPSMKLEVEGAEGREAKLENDDLLPTPLENRQVPSPVYTPHFGGLAV